MKVVLATDGSQNSLHAASVLAALPAREPVEVDVVSAIVHPSLHPADTIATWPEEFWNELNVAAHSAIDETAAIFRDSGATLTKTILEGHAGQTIVQHAVDASADLIVIGAKGHSAIQRVLLGSVSDYVANHAPCSVLVVRHSAVTGATLKSATIAFDGSSRAEFALGQYAELNRSSSTKANVLTVVPMIRFFGRDVLPESLGHRTTQHEMATQVTQRAVHHLETMGCAASADVIEAEHIGEAIVCHAKVNGSDLIVVGDSGLGAVTRMLLGSVSKYVLRHADCSVWIARPVES